MDLTCEAAVKNHVKRSATKLWSLEDEATSKSQGRLIKDAADVEFVDRENLLVADSTGHDLILVKIGDDAPATTTTKEEKNPANDDVTFHDGAMEYRGRKFARILSEEVWPNCLVVTGDSKIRLTDRKTKTIRTYDMRGDLVSVWKTKDDQAMRPHGIGILSTGETVVTDASMHCIHVFSDDGQLLRSFGSRGDLLHHFRLPFFLTVDNDDHIIVSDNMNYCVKIFDRNGNFINRIGSGNLFGHKQFQSPYGITFDREYNEILVADHESNKIFSYDKDGEFIRYYVSGSECESPCGLNIHSSSGLLAVTNSSPDMSNVQLYCIAVK